MNYWFIVSGASSRPHQHQGTLASETADDASNLLILKRKTIALASGPSATTVRTGSRTAD